MRKNSPPTIPTTGQTMRLYFRLWKLQSGVSGLDLCMASEIYWNRCEDNMNPLIHRKSDFKLAEVPLMKQYT